MENASADLTAAWSAVTTGITNIMGNPYAALGITLPIVGLVISIAKKLFRSRRG